MSMADAARLSFPVVELTADQARDVGFGRPLELSVPSNPTGLIAPSGELLALYRPTEAGSRPVAVLV
jgi:tRNA pseudouridine55 synthase